MLRIIVATVGCSAIYGFASGMVHSRLFALRNLIKFPMLILTTASICALAYWVSARALQARLSFAEVQRLVLTLFRDVSAMLASLAPATLFLALTLKQPDKQGLHDYPFFLGLNVCFIAGCGAIALIRQAGTLLGRCAVPRRRAMAIVAVWLILSLGVGGQWAWYLRPFYGVATVPAPFCMGTAPDHRGARSFYEAVYHLLRPPPFRWAGLSS